MCIRRLTFLFFLGFYSLFIIGQNTFIPYRSDANMHYWKNRKPHAAYWQQDVHYRIKLRMDDNKHILHGNLSLTYYNNSPDTLNHVYFHLYQNAFLPQSYYHQMSISNNRQLRFGSYQKQGKGTEVAYIYVNKEPHQGIFDNTLMRINLNTPLKSGDSAVFEMDFRTYFNEDGGWSRMMMYKRWGFKHFNGAHFYPRIAVYDAKFGWNTDQHLVHEFYGNFGTYDVELDFPHNYIIEATGLLLNEAEVLPIDLKEKINLKHFKEKPFNENPSIIIPYDSTKRKIWRYHAINIHDFAFVASPTYRIANQEFMGVNCIAIVHEPHASRWQTATELTADIIKVFSEKVGTYHYPKMVVADAFSGMEYPMLTMNSGHAPDYAYIFTHEIGHNWFYGMVGSNETYNAFIDEGFTQYLTVYGLNKLSQTHTISSLPSSKFKQRFKKEELIEDKHAYNRYLNHAIKTEGVKLNTHSDMFDTKQPYGEEYRQSYYKGAVMLFNLEYVLGKELFDKSLKSFYEQWRFCHPYAEDVRASFIQSSQVDLNWFFDQFLETPKSIDYGIKKLKKAPRKDYYYLSFERKGSMQMPIDFQIITKKDSLINYHIPNTDFVKQTSANVLPKWVGWMHFNPNYSVEIFVPHGIKNIHIDTTQALADIYMLDNSLKMPKSVSFDYLINQPLNRRHYQVYYRPDIWWNSIDGLKMGINMNSHYMKHHHISNISLFYNTEFLKHSGNPIASKFSYLIDYNTPLGRYNKTSRIYLKALNNHGVHKYALKTTHKIPKKNHTLYAEISTIRRCYEHHKNYSLYPNAWDGVNINGKPNFHNKLKLGFTHDYKQSQRNGYIQIETNTSYLFSPFDYSLLSFTSVNEEHISLLTFRSRIFGQIATGKKMPMAGMLYLSGANPEDIIENPITSAHGIIPSVWGDYGPNTNRFHAGGGLNVRGYAGYIAPEIKTDGSMISTYKGHSGVSINTELEFQNIFNLKPPYLKDYVSIQTYFFADAGTISVNPLNTSYEFSKIRFSSGLGFACHIKKWFGFDKIKPLTLRLDFPLILNRPPAIADNYFTYRWIVGVNRAF